MKYRYRLTAALVLLLSGLVYSAEESVLVQDNSSTIGLLSWSENCLRELENDPSKANNAVDIYRRAFVHFEKLNPVIIRQNLNFDADLQVLRRHYLVALYWWAQDSSCDQLRAENVLKEMLENKAQPELLLAPLKKLEQWEDYYKNCLLLLRKQEREPDKVLYRLENLPELLIQDQYSAETLRILLAVMDIFKQKNWDTSTTKAQQKILELTLAMKKKGHYGMALAALGLVEDMKKTEELKREAQSLQKLKEEQETQSQESLY